MNYRSTRLLVPIGACFLSLAGTLLEADVVDSSYSLTWLAGSGYPGSSDGIGTNASFNILEDLAIDRNGTVYVADQGNSTIRKISPIGEVTTFAGAAGSIGSSDGMGTNARFNHPDGIAIDSDGNLFVGDTDNSTIRKITSNGLVTTFAGSVSQTGNQDGIGTNASFRSPEALSVDGAGNVYVADTFNCIIRKITPLGEVSTLAGKARVPGYQDGTGTNALFVRPSALVVDGKTNVYVTDSGSYTLRKITPAGVVTTVKAIDHSIGKTVVFNFSHIAADGSGNLYYDSNESDVCVITPKGVIKTIFVVPILDDNGRLNSIKCVATDQVGNIYLSLYDNSVWKLSLIPTKNQTISFAAIPAKLYGSPPFDIKATASSGLPVSLSTSDTNVITIASNTATIVGAGTATIQGAQPGDSFYKPVTVNKVLVVGKAAQTIPFRVLKPQTYGDGPVILPWVSSAGTSVVCASSKTNVAVISSSTAAILGAGLTTITATAPASANYSAVTVRQVLVVGKAPQTISFLPPLANDLLKGATIPLTATSTSGLPVSFKSSNPRVVSIAGATATLLNKGNAILTATQVGNANWKAAPPVPITVSVQ